MSFPTRLWNESEWNGEYSSCSAHFRSLYSYIGIFLNWTPNHWNQTRVNSLFLTLTIAGQCRLNCTWNSIAVRWSSIAWIFPIAILTIDRRSTAECVVLFLHSVTMSRFHFAKGNSLYTVQSLWPTEHVFSNLQQTTITQIETFP